MSRTPPLPEPAGVIVVGTQALRAFTADQIHARDRQIVEACIEVAAQLDCAHRCGVGSELAAALRSLLGEGEGKE